MTLHYDSLRPRDVLGFELRGMTPATLPALRQLTLLSTLRRGDGTAQRELDLRLLTHTGIEELHLQNIKLQGGFAGVTQLSGARAPRQAALRARGQQLGMLHNAADDLARPPGLPSTHPHLRVCIHGW